MVKKLVDPNAPKRPMSGYFMWMASGVREKMLAKQKVKKVSVVMSACGELWSKMPEAQKKVWQDKAKHAKAVWTKKMAGYMKTSSFKEFEKKKAAHKLTKVKKAKKPKDKNAPKRPLSGFFRFMKVFRKNNPTLGLTEVTKGAGEKWKAMPESSKKKFMDAAESDKAKYQKEVAKYKKSSKFAKYQEELKAFKKQQKMKMKKFKGQN